MHYIFAVLNHNCFLCPSLIGAITADVVVGLCAVLALPKKWWWKLVEKRLLAYVTSATVTTTKSIHVA